MQPPVLTAKDVMLESASLHRLDRGSTLVKKLSGRFHALPVVNDDDEVVGIVSEHDILDALREQKSLFQCSAESIMSCGHLDHDCSCRTPVAVSPDTPIHDVLRSMYRYRLSVVPVVKEGRLIGVIDRRDVMIA